MVEPEHISKELDRQLKDLGVELRPNNCEITFECKDCYGCVYRNSTKSEKIVNCKYKASDNMCDSTVARVNAMVIKLKEYGISFK